ncbi:hypothetical protein HON86_01460 [Candidatus Woesearchaeota archaeon]|jgi:hypothetical protein|nr:hypothetical protein [Candidatus Woesearchaeota archaeon]MBT4835269.1 hypothetical protein [Candidatus Woesearchaeota archaeon]MBT6734746.1 hypothetical protein [Candidatus Woesearchaeota archaeon]MBT7474335.1 hypothetical protein [Candidatus Woesearchaeota archaeon]
MVDFSKSWVPVVILIIIIVSTFTFLIFKDNFSTGVRSPSQPLPGCVEMKNDGNYAESIDIVFLADNFENLDKFRKISDEMVKSFFETTPYDEYKDRFNFFRIEKLDNDYNCDYNYGGDAIVCKPGNIKRAAASCPNDYPIVLVDVSGIQKLFQHLRSSAWMGTASLNSDDDPLVFTHEFAHLFADFADEYEFEGDVDWSAPNCDSDLSSCSKFDIVDDHECILGCVNRDHARSIHTGIMRDYWKSKVYGNYNEAILREIIEEDSRPQTSELQKSPLNYVELQYSMGNWNIISVTEGEGFADQFSNDGDLIEIIDSSGNSLASVSLKSPILFSCGHDKDSKPDYSNIIIEGSSYMVGLPILEDSEKIIVKMDDKIVSSHNLNDYDISGVSDGKIINIPEIF